MAVQEEGRSTSIPRHDDQMPSIFWPGYLCVAVSGALYGVDRPPSVATLVGQPLGCVEQLVLDGVRASGGGRRGG